MEVQFEEESSQYHNFKKNRVFTSFQTTDHSTYAHIAAFLGNEQLIYDLIYLDSQLIRSRNDEGSTPAHIAAAVGNLNIIQILASNEPDILAETDTDGWNTAHVACFYNRTQILQFLTLHTPKIFSRANEDGQLPLDLCFDESCRHFVQTQLDIQGSKTLLREKVRPKTKKTNIPKAIQIGQHNETRSTTSISTKINEIAGYSVETSVASKIAGDKGPFLEESAKDLPENFQTAFQASTYSSDDLVAASESSVEPGIECAIEYRKSNPTDFDLTMNALEPVSDLSNGWQMDTTTSEQASKWKSLLSNFKKGTDITSVLIPAEFLRPESSLERLQDIMQHGKLMENIPKCLDPVERLIAVTRFHVSGVIRAIFDGKKPYNPVLGETCAWQFDHNCPEAGISQMICEQVAKCLLKLWSFSQFSFWIIYRFLITLRFLHSFFKIKRLE
jgi:ankyrin repeat protein